MKLHLGCGQVHLDGYVNIDYPLSEHTVQRTSVADKFADITKLRYKAGTIEEVRLHHVFEHFHRAQAVALMMSWNSWLKKGGKLTIEVPDFDAMTIIALSPLSSNRKRMLALRHIFGSQEAQWAVHFNGWSAARLLELASLAGFTAAIHKPKPYKNLHNVVLEAHKVKSIKPKQALSIARKYLSMYLVDDSSTEKKMLAEWMSQFETQVKRTWAR